MFSKNKHKMLLFSVLLIHFIAKDKEEIKMKDESLQIVQLMTKMSTYYPNHKNLVKLITKLMINMMFEDYW